MNLIKCCACAMKISGHMVCHSIVHGSGWLLFFFLQLFQSFSSKLFDASHCRIFVRLTRPCINPNLHLALGQKQKKKYSTCYLHHCSLLEIFIKRRGTTQLHHVCLGNECTGGYQTYFILPESKEHITRVKNVANEPRCCMERCSNVPY